MTDEFSKPVPKAPNATSLKERLEAVRQRTSLAGDKPQDLPWESLVDRVRYFLESQRSLIVPYAFGNEVGADLEVEDDNRFDPIKLLAEDPDSRPTIEMYVLHEVRNDEPGLLARRSTSIFAYNTLVFAAGLYLRDNLIMSNDLREFASQHMMSPAPPATPKQRGKPKKKTEDDLFKINAIQFAAKHGKTPTRNDEASMQQSACDAVAEAAQLIYRATGQVEFASGYSYENLKKIWKGRRANPWVGKQN